MVLTNSGSLFQNQGLLQEDGLLSERWAQNLSTYQNFYFDNNASATIHTVTAGKKLYIAGMFTTTSGAAGNGFQLRDGGAAGAVVLNVDLSAAAGQQQTITFNPPLVFETDLYNLVAGANNGKTTLTGWEE